MADSNGDGRRTMPGWPYWVILVGGLVSYWPIQALGTAGNIDRGFVNVGVLVAFLAGIGLFVARWLQLRGWRQLMLGAGGTLVLLVVLASTVRISKTTGSLLPEFAWRWAKEPDQRLGDVKTVPSSAGMVDLTTTTPDDYPQFLGPQRLNVLRGVELTTDWEAHPPRLVWRREIGAGWSSFSAVNGHAVTMEQRDDKELVTCFDIQTGSPRWVHEINARHATLLGYVGPRSTPTISDGKVYALGATGVLRCLKGEDGTELWSHNLFAEHGFNQESAEGAVFWGRAASPLVHAGKVIVPVGGPANGPWITLVAYDAITGEPVWKAEGRQASYASPAIATFRGVPQIVSVNEDFVSSHDPETGEVLWEFDWPGKSGSNANVSQAVPIDDKSLYISKGYDGQAAVFDIEPPVDGKWPTPQKRWGKNVMKTKFSNVSLLDGYAYGLDHGVLTCVELASGRRKWKGGRYNYGQSLLVDNVLLIITENGEIALAAATPEKFVEYAKLSVLDDQTWNNPCLYGCFLLFRNATEAVCYELPCAKSQSSRLN